MARDTHPHNALIDAIGPTKVRTHFGQTPQALYAWRIRGIPYAQRGAFAVLAGAHGVMLPSNFFSPPADQDSFFSEQAA